MGALISDIIKAESSMGPRNKTADNFFNQPFKDLKKILKNKKRTAEPDSAKKEAPLGDDDCFAEAMKEVQEIKEYREMPVYQKYPNNRCVSRPSDHETLRALEEIVAGKRPVHLPYTPDYIEWIDQDYREDIIERLHAGKYSIQDCLDLHGKFVEEAKREVEFFLKLSAAKGYRCIKIIHGRGLRSPNGPVLKDAVVKWLLSSFRKYLIAFVTARQCDGGLGALYVLLK